MLAQQRKQIGFFGRQLGRFVFYGQELFVHVEFEFSEKTGLSIEEISLLERVGTDPKLSTLQSLAAYMDLTVSDLLKIEGS